MHERKLSAEAKRKLIAKIANMKRRKVAPSVIAKTFVKGVLTASAFKKVFKK